MEWCLDVCSFSVFEMRPSCSPQSFLLVTFQECSRVVSVTKLLGACWRSLPGERNINSRVFSTKLYQIWASFLSCQCLFRGITLNISLSEDPSLLCSNCKQQSWAGFFSLCYMLTFHCGLKPLFLSWRVPSIPLRYFTSRFVTAVLGTLSRKAEYKALRVDY